jgi:tripartite-type tricarboxylate transporter receptor subunit TctC
VKALLVTLLEALSFAAAAQSYPSKPVRIVVPVTAGGLHDVLMRAFAQELSRVWSQPVIVENRSGANHIVATEYVVKSPADGHTLLMTDKAFVANPLLFSKLPYDGSRDLIPVANVVMIPAVLVVPGDFPANTLVEFADMAKKQPGKLNYGSFGIGSVAHVELEGISRVLGMKLNHVPYKGIADVVPAMLNGQLQLAYAGVPPVLQLVRQGRLRLLAYSGSKRSPLIPDVPTYVEAGLKGYTAHSWTGFFVPTGTPGPIVSRLADDLGKVVTNPEFEAKYLTSVGLEKAFLPGQQFVDLINADRASYGERVKALNIKLD